MIWLSGIGWDKNANGRNWKCTLFTLTGFDNPQPLKTPGCISTLPRVMPQQTSAIAQPPSRLLANHSTTEKRSGYQV